MSNQQDNACYRLGVGIILLNKQNQVFVGRRVDAAQDAWQMPQGGIDEGETPYQAVLRELLEEVGTNKVTLLKELEPWLSYELPSSLRAQLWGGRYIGQKQKWFVFRFDGDDSEINIYTEVPEFSAWKWVAVSSLPNLAVSFKKQMYEQLLTKLKHDMSFYQYDQKI